MATIRIKIKTQLVVSYFLKLIISPQLEDSPQVL